jgi:ABC-type transport system involved in multi-copper enzyme maturation permease subunit
MASSQPKSDRPARLRLTAWALLALAFSSAGAAIVGGEPSWLLLALVAVLRACHALTVPPRRAGEGLLGPLFFYDVVRLARRGRSTLLRCAYALALLGALCLAYHLRFPDAPLLHLGPFYGPNVAVHELPRFAQTITLALLLAQGAAVLGLTPAYVAGAVAEEKERGTLPLLLTTHLTDREIVLGKLLARLAHLGGVFLAGVPVLCLTLLWGGVSAPLLAAGFVANAATLLSVGGVCLLCSVLCRSVLQALVWSYALVAGISITCASCFLSSPVAFVVFLDGELRDLTYSGPAAPAGVSGSEALTAIHWTNVYIALHLLIGYGCLVLAVAWLRSRGLSEGPAAAAPHPAPADELAAGGVPATEVARQPDDAGPALRDPPPPVGDRPLLWKEMFKGGQFTAGPSLREFLRKEGVALLVALFALGVITLAVYGVGPERGHALSELLNWTCRFFGIVLAGAWCVGVAFRAAGSISRERERGTLDGLLTLPIPRDAILRAKWLGSALRWRGLGYGLVALWSFGLVTGGLHPLAVLLWALACAVLLALLAGAGLCLSLTARNTLWANVSMAAVLLFLFWVPWVVWINGVGVRPGPEDWQAHFSEYGLNPLASWWFAGFAWFDMPAPSGTGAQLLQAQREAALFWARLVAVCAGLALQAGAAGLLWLLARRRFRSTYGR